jgi:hypothetical protein
MALTAQIPVFEPLAILRYVERPFDKLRVLQKYSHYVPYFCGEAGIEAGCKQVLIMLLRDVFNFIPLGSGDSAIIL